MNRLWLRTSLLLLCLVQFLTVSKSGLANEPAPGEKLFPKDTLVFLSLTDVKQYKQKWQHSSFGQLLQDPQMKPFLDDVNKKIEEELKELEESIGLSLGSLLELAQGQLTIAVLEKPQSQISVIGLIEFGDHQSNVDKLLEATDDALEKNGFEHSTEEIEKLTVHKYSRKPDGAGDPLTTVTYFTDRSSLVVSTQSAAIKEVLERWDGKSDDTLADNEQYQYIQSQCKTENSEPLFKIFVNPSGIIRSAISVAQTSFPQAGMATPFIPMLGLDGIKGWGGASDFGEGDVEWIANFFTYADQPRGLLAIFDFPASQLAPPKWVPANVASYFTMNWNIQGAYRAVESMIDMFQGPGATGRMLDSVAERGPGIHPKKDLIDHLDGRIHFTQSEPKEAENDDEPAAPIYFVGLGLKDATKMKKTLAAAAKASSSNLETRDFNGETIYEVENSSTASPVSFAVSEGTLFITNDVQMLEGVMRGQSGRGLSLAESPDYKRVSKLFPSKSSMLAFQRSDAQIKTYYDLAKQAGSDYLDGVDFSKLPPFEVISKYMTASGSYSVPDKKGMKTVSYSMKKSD